MPVGLPASGRSWQLGSRNCSTTRTVESGSCCSFGRRGGRTIYKIEKADLRSSGDLSPPVPVAPGGGEKASFENASATHPEERLAKTRRRRGTLLILPSIILPASAFNLCKTKRNRPANHANGTNQADAPTDSAGGKIMALPVLGARMTSTAHCDGPSKWQRHKRLALPSPATAAGNASSSFLAFCT